MFLARAEPSSLSNGNMTIQQCFRVISKTFLFKIIFPKWFFNLPIARCVTPHSVLCWIHIANRVQESRVAFETLASFMQEQVQRSKSDIRNLLVAKDNFTRDNAFTRLLEANEAETARLRLDDDEVVSFELAKCY